MFRSVKLKNLPLTVFSLICLVIFVAVCLLMLRAGAPDTVTIGGDRVSLRYDGDADVEAFLSACGVRADEMLSEREVTVPALWNDIYTEYNELQLAQGFDLTPYKGKSATERTYLCGDSTAVLLLGGGRIIAAHLSDADGGGMRALIEP